MKTKLFLSLIVGCTVALSGCSSLFSSNNSNQPSAKELEEFHKYEKDLYNRLSASMIEPAKKEDRFERQIVNEYFSYYLNECAYHDFSAYKSGKKCNIGEIEKDPYNIEFMIPVKDVDKGSDTYGEIVRLLVMADYTPGKSAIARNYYRSDLDAAPELNTSGFIRYRNHNYNQGRATTWDLTKSIPQADFNNIRYSGFEMLNLEQKKIFGSVNTFNFSKEDCYESENVPYVKASLDLLKSIGLR